MLDAETTQTSLVETNRLPLVPIREFVMLPYVLAPIIATQPNVIAAAEAALATADKTLVVATEKNANESEADLATVGTKVVIKQMRREGGQIQLIVQGVERVNIQSVESKDKYTVAVFDSFTTIPSESDVDIEARKRVLLEMLGKMLQLSHPNDFLPISNVLAATEDPFHLVFLIASMLEMETDQAQRLLETSSATDAMTMVQELLQREIDVLEVKGQIDDRINNEMTEQHREMMLRQQMRAIQQELGERSPAEAESSMLREQLEKADLPDHVHQAVSRELRRLEQIDPAAPDYQITKSYVELILELPWKVSTTDSIDLDKALKILNEDHYGLEKIKDRIIEHLAVMKLNPEGNAPILCFFGPPGVGKTSLGQSIARAIGRKFERISLGGMHDESELRGHRRTYVGAMPGGIIQSIRKAGVNNPLLMLDEMDKLGRDFRGDPAAALLEILDPSQNSTFRDNYLNMPFDLSKTMFIATANSLDTIPGPLFDRMEIIELSGYTDEEKIQIAKKYLIPRQLKNSGVDRGLLKISSKALAKTVSSYTREAGVRQLERAIGTITRKAAVRIAKGDSSEVTVKAADLPAIFGKPVRRPEQMKKQLAPGTATGLAWTSAGGEVLFIEGLLLPNGGGLQLTGQLGSVMQESAHAAQSFIWSHAQQLGIDASLFRSSGVHLHVPAGSIPKDGPSAGVTMATALASLYTGLPVRADTAMTGEITLGGDVLPIGGVKNKVLAARAAGIKQVILPKANENDLDDLPDDIRKELTFVFASHIKEVLKAAIPELKFHNTENGKPKKTPKPQK